MTSLRQISKYFFKKQWHTTCCVTNCVFSCYYLFNSAFLCFICIYDSSVTSETLKFRSSLSENLKIKCRDSAYQHIHPTSLIPTLIKVELFPKTDLLFPVFTFLGKRYCKLTSAVQSIVLF